MSTKIYNAYRLKKKNISLAELDTILDIIKEQAVRAANNLLYERALRHVILFTDLKTYFGKDYLTSMIESCEDGEYEKKRLLKVVRDGEPPSIIFRTALFAKK